MEHLTTTVEISSDRRDSWRTIVPVPINPKTKRKEYDLALSTAMDQAQRDFPNDRISAVLI